MKFSHTIVAILLIGIMVFGIYVSIPDRIIHTIDSKAEGGKVEKTSYESPLERFVKRRRILAEEKLSQDIQGYWELTDLQGALPEIHGLHLDIYRGANNKAVRGDSGCNMISGSLMIQPDRFTKLSDSLTQVTLNFSQTLMGCEPERMNFENDYSGLLGRVRSYKVLNGQLVFMDQDGKVILKYRRYKDGVPVQQPRVAGPGRMVSNNGMKNRSVASSEDVGVGAGGHRVVPGSPGIESENSSIGTLQKY